MNTADREAAPRVGQRPRRARRGLARRPNVAALLGHSLGAAPARSNGRQPRDAKGSDAGADSLKNAPGLRVASNAPPLTADHLRELTRIWYGKAKRSGFHDIEDERGNLARSLPEPGDHRAGKRGKRQGQGGPIPYNEEGNVQRSVSSGLSDHLWAAYWRMRFPKQKDRAICLRLARGLTWDEIKRRLKCGNDRIQRVVDSVGAWKDPDDEEE